MLVLGPLSHHLDLYDYWVAIRGTRAMPARSDVNPADIPQLLPFLVLVERSEGQLRYRLVGTAIARAAGYDPTGCTVGSYIPAPEIAAEVRAVFGRVFTAAGPAFATGEYFHKTGTHVDLSLLNVPLSADGRAVNMSLSTLVACFSAVPALERGWLAGVPVRVRGVTSIGDATELKTLCLEWEQRCLHQPQEAASHKGGR
jgi:hypothetical protein